MRGEWKPERPLTAHWSMGNRKPQDDIVWGLSDAWIYLSPQLQQLFRDYQVSGWLSYPIVLHNKDGEVCPGYAGISITGRCGPIDEEGGQVVPGQKAGIKFIQRVGLYFDESSWDGSDFFCPAGNNTYMFATERVKSLLEENEIRGFKFTPLTHAPWISWSQD